MSKKINVAYATAVSLGAIIGSGIFVLSGTVISLAGILSLVAFAFVGFVSLILAFELGELTSLFPELKGSSYSFAYEAFGSHIGFVTGILLYFSYASSISAIALGFGAYLSSILGLGNPIVFAILLILVLTVLNLMGVEKAAEADFYLVLLKVAILIIFSAFAILTIGRTNLPSHFTVPPNASYGFFESMQGIIFAYSGFQSVSTIASDVEGGGKGAAKAIVYSVVISLVLYVLVDVSLMILAPVTAYKISADPLSFALSYAKAPSSLFLVVGVGALIATTSATLAMILTSSRMLYQIGADGLLPKFVTKYDKSRDVAVNGVLISSLIGVATLFAGNVYVIAAISNFGLLFSYLVTSLAVMHFRRKNANPQFKTPGYPYLPAFSVIAIVLFFIGMPQEALLIGAVTTIVLLIAYSVIREGMRESPEKVRIFEYFRTRDRKS
ncbi:amino acid permease [Metallosphaera tengchongensis]|uniref:Amino acid permease n=1 Tax=Metallosphaera tengchongensis TaxID=1532350 RepID=A0A6N0NVP5_9CREN|nr:amino acid permease [Metallosphaera tengchongensis]QKR00285.1 amino acid permease [Metallosphaera tengchongensis]